MLLSALGVVEATIDGQPVSGDLLTPGWTSYEWRLRYSDSDVTALLEENRDAVSRLDLLSAMGGTARDWAGQGAVGRRTTARNWRGSSRFRSLSLTDISS